MRVRQSIGVAIGMYATISVSSAFADPALSQGVSLKSWFQRVQQEQHSFRQSLPASVAGNLSTNDPNFFPFVFRDEQAEGAPSVARGDFNCDGQEDYAITGVKKDSILATVFQSETPDQASLERAQKEFQLYLREQPAAVMVGLTSKVGDFRWLLREGSSVSYQKDNCGCCGSTTDAESARMKKKGCGFLFIGCCEKDGSYLLWEEESSKIRIEDGC